VGELPNSHDRTLTDKSYVLHGIPYKLVLLYPILRAPGKGLTEKFGIDPIIAETDGWVKN
jgi:hypothetical protein